MSRNFRQEFNVPEYLLKTVFSLSIEDLEGEIWVDAIGFDGLYEVSNLGRIKSLERWVPNGGSGRLVKEIIRRQAISKDGRLTCSMSTGGKTYSINPSGMIYFSFNPTQWYESSKNCITHKNKIPYDNRLVNLMLDDFSHSHKINWKKGLLSHLEKHHKKVVDRYNALTERKCKVCQITKPIKKFKRGCRKCLHCEYLHRSKPSFRQTNEIKIKCLTTGELFVFNNIVEMAKSQIIGRLRFRKLQKEKKNTFVSFKKKMEYQIISIT